MLLLTLDTNAFIYALDFDHESPQYVEEVNGLIRHAFHGRVNLALTTAAARDLANDSDGERKQQMLQKLQLFPLVPAVFRVGFSQIEGGDTLAGEQQSQLSDRVTAILHRQGLDPASTRATNNLNDIDHLVAHATAQRDVFVTTDKPILRRSALLEGELGLRVLAPDAALELVERTVDVALTAADFLQDFALLSAHISSGLQSPVNIDDGGLPAAYADVRRRVLASWEKLRVPFTQFQIQRPLRSPLAKTLDYRLGPRTADSIEDCGYFFEREVFTRQLIDLADWAAEAQPSSDPVQTVERELERWRTLLQRFCAFLEAAP